MKSAPLVLIIKSAFEALGDPRFSRNRFDLFRNPKLYHLLQRTPETNINRIMRHVGGVYTQTVKPKGIVGCDLDVPGKAT